MFVSAAGDFVFTDTIKFGTPALLVIMALPAYSDAGEILLIHDIVGDDLPAPCGQCHGPQLGILLGPAVGGGLMLWTGAPTGLLVNALITFRLQFGSCWFPHRPLARRARRGAAALARCFQRCVK
jgi:hypothetical protein